MIANVLTLPGAASRHDLIVNELLIQNAVARFWPGEVAQWRVMNGISRAHKNVIRNYVYRWPGEECLVLEDDVKFTHKDSLKYFLAHKPTDYDLYLGCISGGNIESDGTTKDFSGLLCYICHPRFMQTFLSADELVDIDRWMTIFEEGKIIPRGKFIVSNPFVCTTHNTYSEHHKKEMNYDEWFKGRNLYKG
jgi:hypothetical protein